MLRGEYRAERGGLGPSGDLVPAVMASSALPGVFPPKQIGGEHFIDGGIVNSIPLDRACKLGATRAFVLQVGRIEQSLKVPNGPGRSPRSRSRWLAGRDSMRP